MALTAGGWKFVRWLYGRRPRAGLYRLPGVVSLACLTWLAGCAPKPLSVAPLVREWSYRGEQGLEIRTVHWTIFTTSRYPHWMDNLPRFAEAAYSTYRALVPASPSARNLRLYVFGNSLQWMDYAHSMGISPTDVDLVSQLGGFAWKDVASVHFAVEPARTLAAIGHVGMQQYLWLHDAGDAPLWVREGLATQAEAFDQRDGRIDFNPRFNGTRAGQLRLAIAKGWLLSPDELLSLEDFRSYPDPTIAAQTYLAQLWATMLFLQEHKDYRDGYQQLRLDLGTGTWRQKVEAYQAGSDAALSPEQATFRIYITSDLAKFERQFLDWANDYLHMVGS